MRNYPKSILAAVLTACLFIDSVGVAPHAALTEPTVPIYGCLLIFNTEALSGASAWTGRQTKGTRAVRHEASELAMMPSDRGPTWRYRETPMNAALRAEDEALVRRYVKAPTGE